MAILRFRIYWEEDESVYRDINVLHTQTFLQLHQGILKSWEFDGKHEATFFRSNDNWQKGREISLIKYEKEYRVEPLLMEDVVIGTEIKSPNQRFIYLYDFKKNWEFMVELIKVDKDSANSKFDFPLCVRTEGMGPSQYGTKELADKRLAEMEEKYDLKAGEEGYGSEGDDDDNSPEEDSEDLAENADGDNTDYDF